jgi:hypothetical protein
MSCKRFCDGLTERMSIIVGVEQRFAAKQDVIVTVGNRKDRGTGLALPEF